MICNVVGCGAPVIAVGLCRKHYDRQRTGPSIRTRHAPGAGLDSAGRLAVNCWCERTIVSVPQPDVVHGITRTCGHPHCQRMAADRMVLDAR